MKKIILALVFIALFSQLKIQAQVEGALVPNSQLTTIKVWGTNYQMGYAYGYYMGTSINDLCRDYLKPAIGSSIYSYVRDLVSDSNNINISSDILSELDGIIEAMNATGVNSENLDRTDLIIANSFIDISAFAGTKSIDMGCSALMSWGDATNSGSLNGKSVVTRHLDWTTNQDLISAMVLCVHLPSEAGKRPWMSLGFSGVIGGLSAMNSDMAVFQNMMSDYSGATPQLGQAYTPIWMSLRKVVETDDLNGDGHNNTADLKYEIDQQTNGFAPAVMLYAMARSTENNDSLIAMIAEVAPEAPKVTYRYNSLPDSIPSDNLYLANEQIQRNNEYNFSMRYNNVANVLSSNPNIDTANSWSIMRDYSHLNSNIMMMQFAPEEDVFRLSVYYNQSIPYSAAYNNPPVEYSISNLLSTSTAPLSISDDLSNPKAIYLYPNPATNYVCINITKPNLLNDIKIMDINGKLILHKESTNKEVEMISVEDLVSGTYIVVIENGSEKITEKVVISD